MESKSFRIISLIIIYIIGLIQIYSFWGRYPCHITILKQVNCKKKKDFIFFLFICQMLTAVCDFQVSKRNFNHALQNINLEKIISPEFHLFDYLVFERIFLFICLTEWKNKSWHYYCLLLKCDGILKLCYFIFEFRI